MEEPAKEQQESQEQAREHRQTSEAEERILTYLTSEISEAYEAGERAAAEKGVSDDAAVMYDAAVAARAAAEATLRAYRGSDPLVRQTYTQALAAADTAVAAALEAAYATDHAVREASYEPDEEDEESAHLASLRHSAYYASDAGYDAIAAMFEREAGLTPRASANAAAARQAARQAVTDRDTAYADLGATAADYAAAVAAAPMDIDVANHASQEFLHAQLAADNARLAAVTLLEEVYYTESTADPTPVDYAATVARAIARLHTRLAALRAAAAASRDIRHAALNTAAAQFASAQGRVGSAVDPDGAAADAYAAAVEAAGDALYENIHYAGADHSAAYALAYALAQFDYDGDADDRLPIPLLAQRVIDFDTTLDTALAAADAAYVAALDAANTTYVAATRDAEEASWGTR